MAPKNTKSNKDTQKVEEPVAPKVEEVKVVEAAPKAQKGGKKAVGKVEAAPAPVVEAAPVVEKPKAQKGGKKAAAEKPKEETPAPVVAEEKPKAKRGGAKKVATEAVAAEKPKKAAAKKVAAEKPKKDDEEEDGEATTGGRLIRSFKVKLPGNQEFEGRFTGLTPYQAANKALSKYFREADGTNVNAEITFSICESTRKSRKNTYTYVGKRLKLDTPVKYTIQDGREIVKNFKNSLKKVKKNVEKAATA